MLVIGTSQKGGAGRSVTLANVAYRLMLRGHDVCLVDFDLGAPSLTGVFDIPTDAYATGGGIHSYLQGEVPEPVRLDAHTDSERSDLRGRPPGGGRLVVLPGDEGGYEFAPTPEGAERCVKLMRHLDEEFEVIFFDLSAGRSYAAELVLTATARREMNNLTVRWLTFYRWSRQQLFGAADLVNGRSGLIETAERWGHERRWFKQRLRYVRTALVHPDSDELAGLRAPQVAWLRDYDRELLDLASRLGIGRTSILGSVPHDPVLQWREQILTDNDVAASQIANRATVDAFELLGQWITDDDRWQEL